MLGDPSERNLKQTINGGENPMHTPVDNLTQAEDPVTNRVTVPPNEHHRAKAGNCALYNAYGKRLYGYFHRT